MAVKLGYLLIVCLAVAGAAWSITTGYIMVMDGMLVVGICALATLIAVLSRFEFGQREIGCDSNKSHVLLGYYR